MYKLYFAEDEVCVRRAIIDTVDWNSAGFSVCGESGNGEQALREVLQQKPDVLITDIKMPGMDGLELSRLAKKELPNLVIIIISGYDAYVFTHEAIQIGVTDYILKPITVMKLLKALNRAVEQIEQYKDERRKQTIMQSRWVNGSMRLGSEELINVHQVVDRGAILDFVKTAEYTEIQTFAKRQAKQIWEIGQDNSMYFLCSIYDVLATLSDAVSSMGITVGGTGLLLQPGEEIASQEELEQFLISCLERIIRTRDKMADSKSQLVNRARLYMEEHHSEAELSLTSVASAMNVAPNYLSALINRESGQSFSEYLNELRIRHAMEMLRSSTDSLSDIAKKVGYNDAYYFSKIFKKTLGVSPREFKKMKITKSS